MDDVTKTSTFRLESLSCDADKKEEYGQYSSSYNTLTKVSCLTLYCAYLLNINWDILPTENRLTAHNRILCQPALQSNAVSCKCAANF